MTAIQHSRAGRRQAVRRIRPRHTPATPLPVLAWAGAAGVLWLWWRDTPAVAATTADRLTHAVRMTGLLAGYVIALTVAQTARIPAAFDRAGV